LVEVLALLFDHLRHGLPELPRPRPPRLLLLHRPLRHASRTRAHASHPRQHVRRLPRAAAANLACGGAPGRHQVRSSAVARESSSAGAGVQEGARMRGEALCCVGGHEEHEDCRRGQATRPHPHSCFSGAAPCFSGLTINGSNSRTSRMAFRLQFHKSRWSPGFFPRTDPSVLQGGPARQGRRWAYPGALGAGGDGGGGCAAARGRAPPSRNPSFLGPLCKRHASRNAHLKS
jgi:hypothetical protein